VIKIKKGFKKTFSVVVIFAATVALTGCDASEITKKAETQTENLMDTLTAKADEMVAACDQVYSESEPSGQEMNSTKINLDLNSIIQNKDTNYNVTEMAAVKYTKTDLNVRTGPSVDYDKMGAIPINQEVTITGQADTGWYQIIYQGAVGFVSAKYLADEPAEIVESDTLATQIATVTETGTTDQSISANSEYNKEMEQEMLELLNADRVSNGLNAVTTTPELMNAAAMRALETYSTFSHTRPDGTSCFTVLGQYGAVYNEAGENLALRQTLASDTETDWMASEGHRKNILNGNFTHVGVACFVAPDGTMSWVQIFTDK